MQTQVQNGQLVSQNRCHQRQAMGPQCPTQSGRRQPQDYTRLSQTMPQLRVGMPVNAQQYKTTQGKRKDDSHLKKPAGLSEMPRPGRRAC